MRNPLYVNEVDKFLPRLEQYLAAKLIDLDEIRCGEFRVWLAATGKVMTERGGKTEPLLQIDDQTFAALTDVFAEKLPVDMPTKDPKEPLTMEMLLTKK